ncbi:hypothetical protein [Stenotrophomonas maltophilia]|uniref:hypothetical protein n=1 Tax=Stenotrophomonas maltophilia TaxID=40324 RepID=UPI0012AFEFEF|nr:hypothetical protein [Stenotrophomonas maltophilia]QGL66671.1 hypothetical protein FEO86_04985 [Stenotrophomonas maltophilia]
MAAVAGGNIFGNAQRILFKALPPGDWKKFGGVSNNDPKAGGGARDLRYNGFEDFERVAKALFPTKMIRRTRDGTPKLISAYQGSLKHTFGPSLSDDAFFENPTDVRDAEWRFTKVSSKSPIALATPQAGEDDLDILVLVQESPGEVVPVFTTLNTMPPGQISAFIHQVCQAPRKSRSDATPAGFLDIMSKWSDHN